MALEAHECFGVGVAVQIAKVVSSNYERSKLRRCLEPGFHDSAARELLHNEDRQLVLLLSTACITLEEANAQYCNEHYLTC